MYRDGCMLLGTSWATPPPALTSVSHFPDLPTAYVYIWHIYTYTYNSHHTCTHTMRERERERERERNKSFLPQMEDICDLFFKFINLLSLWLLALINSCALVKCFLSIIKFPIILLLFSDPTFSGWRRFSDPT